LKDRDKEKVQPAILLPRGRRERGGDGKRKGALNWKKRGGRNDEKERRPPRNKKDRES